MWVFILALARASASCDKGEVHWTFEPDTEVVRGPGWTPAHASLTSDYPRDNELYTTFGTIDVVQDTEYSSIAETPAWEHFKDDNCKQEVRVMWDGIDVTDADHISSYFVNCGDTPDPIQPRCLARQHTSETAYDEPGVFIRAEGGNGETLGATGGVASAMYCAPWVGILCELVAIMQV